MSICKKITQRARQTAQTCLRRLRVFPTMIYNLHTAALALNAFICFYRVNLSVFQMMDGCDNDMEDVALVENGGEQENPEKDDNGGDVKNIKVAHLRESRGQITLVSFEFL